MIAVVAGSENLEEQETMLMDRLKILHPQFKTQTFSRLANLHRNASRSTKVPRLKFSNRAKPV